MNEKVIKRKLFGWYVYISPHKLSKKKPQKSGVNYGRFTDLCNNRYKHVGGCCERCGRHFDRSGLQMHHILSCSLFPQFGHKKWNLMMLCERCHYTVHSNPVLAAELMQRVARQHGIKLTRALPRAINRRWNEKHPEMSNH